MEKNINILSAFLNNFTILSSCLIKQKQLSKPPPNENLLSDMANVFDSPDSEIGQLLSSKNTGALLNAVGNFVSLINDAADTPTTPPGGNGTNSTEADKAEQAERMNVSFKKNCSFTYFQ